MGSGANDIVDCPQGINFGTSVYLQGGNDKLTVANGNGGYLDGDDGDDVIAVTGASGSNPTPGNSATGVIETGPGNDKVTLIGGSGNTNLIGLGVNGATGNSGNINLGDGAVNELVITGGNGGDCTTLFAGTSGNGGVGSNGGPIRSGSGNDQITITGGNGGDRHEFGDLPGCANPISAGGRGGHGIQRDNRTTVSVFAGPGADTLKVTGGNGRHSPPGTGNDNSTVVGESGNDTIVITGGTSNSFLQAYGQFLGKVDGGRGGDTCQIFPEWPPSQAVYSQVVNCEK